MVRVLKEARDNYSPLEFNVYQNHQDSFIDKSTLNYSLPNRSKVRFIITNENGEIVFKSVPTEQNAGHYKMEIIPGHLPNGIYFFLFITNSNFTTLKLELLN